MEAVIQTKGLLSLPTNPKARALNPSQVLKSRLSTQASRTLGGFSQSLDGVQKFNGVIVKSHGFYKKGRGLEVKAEAGQPFIEEGEVEKPKFLGVEIVTLKKIIPLGLMFFCILFNYTILRDTKDVLGFG